MEKNTDVKIPFLGDNDISNTTSSDQVAPWVEERDRIPLLLAISLYDKPKTSLGPYNLMGSTKRIGIWIDDQTNTVIIGLKGTSSSSIEQDLGDDFIILSSPSYCNLSLVKEASQIVEEITNQIINPDPNPLVGGLAVKSTNPPNFIFAGHSLGGTAAMCMTIKIPGSRGISFNGGAAPTNPITQGPGPARFTHYHIVGDLISSHMTDQAAKVVRIKIPGNEFGSQKPHSSGNLLKTGILFTAQQEDLEYQKWGESTNIQYNVIKHVLAVTKFQTQLQTERVVENSPIPGSRRYMLQ